jgi:ABC-type branched-subunit amino acid transport system substrate-binding protein
LELAVDEVNDSGGINGAPLELIVRDTAADPERGTAAVTELADLGVAAVVGEYHSVVARAAAIQADALGVPYLCSSAVLDALTPESTNWVARLAPPQSRGWGIYADYLLGSRRNRIAVATQPSVYWASGVRVLRDQVVPRGGTVVELDANSLTPTEICDSLVQHGTTALLLLVGYPEPAASIVNAVRKDQRLNGMLLGTPAGQAEFSGWADALGEKGAGVPFLRYLPERLDALGERVRRELALRLGEAPSFVAFEGWDTIAVLAHMLRTHGTDRATLAQSWPHVEVAGTRGLIRFDRTPGITIWQWAHAPIQVAERDPAHPEGFRSLTAADSQSD